MSVGFDDLYKLWPLKGDKGNTRLSYDFVSKQHPYSPMDYLKAAELWQFKASPFQRDRQTLANWLRDEKFVPELKEIRDSGGLSNALEHAQVFKDLAVVVIGEWNRVRRGWWAKVEDVEGRSHFAERALRDHFFQKNWQKALSWCAELFKYASRDSLGNVIMTPTLEWFCNIEERTVACILEGYWGKPEFKQEIERFERPSFDEQEKKELAELFLSTKGNILSSIQPITEGPWKVKVKINGYSLTYNGEEVKFVNKPLTSEDQAAAYKTIASQANWFNKQNYNPKQIKPEDELSLF